MREVQVDPTFPLHRLEGVLFAQPSGRPLLLDAVFPATRLHGEPDTPRPVVLHVGEPWVDGARSRDPWYHAYLATHGFFAVTCDVRAFAEAPFPAQLHDVKAAIRWLRANAAEHGINPKRIGVWGESITATLAALAGLTGDSVSPELEGYSAASALSGHSSAVQAVLWASGGADFPRQWSEKRWQHSKLTLVFGGPVDERLDLARLGSPLHVARSRPPGAPPPPPFLLLHGTRDETTPFEPALELCETIRAAGGEAELVPLLGRFHNWTGLLENPDERWRYWDLAPMALPFWIRHLRPRSGDHHGTQSVTSTRRRDRIGTQTAARATGQVPPQTPLMPYRHDTQVRRLTQLLAQEGLTDLAERVADVIAAGATGTEILLGIRWTLERLQDAKLELSSALRETVADLQSEIRSALDQNEK